MNSFEKEDRHSVPVYPKIPIELVKGKGVWLWDSNGKKYLDLMSSQGVAGIGNCNSELINAVNAQMNKLINCYNPIYNDVRASLLEKLAEITPNGLERSYLCNSGTESIEAALKFARYSTGRKEFVCFRNGFHGRTFGSLSATWKSNYRLPFEPLVPGFTHVEFNNSEELRKNVSENTAGILIELIQGESGVIPARKEFIKEVKEVCEEKEALLIVDEVQTGFARTGEMFACNHFNLNPDILCLGKAIAAGLPMAATICNEKISIGKKMHGSTFGGNPLACAAGLASIEFIEKNNLAENSKNTGNYFTQRLNEINSSLVREVRGIGLMIGMELTTRPAKYLRMLAEKGVLALPAGLTVMRFLPPLTISSNEVDFAVEKISEVIANE